MFCSKCGKQVGDQSHFCTHCGYALSGNILQPTLSSTNNQAVLNEQEADNCTTVGPKKPHNVKRILVIILCIVALLGLLFFLDTVALNGAVFGDLWNSYDADYDDEYKSNNPSKSNENDNDTEEISKIDVLKKYLERNGDLKGYKKLRTINNEVYYEVYEISYNEQKEDVVFSCVQLKNVDEDKIYTYPTESVEVITTIYLNGNSELSKTDWYYFITSNTTYIATANIDKTVFSKSNDTVYDIKITGLIDSKHYDITKSIFLSDLSSTLEYAEELLDETDMDVSLYDLGYINYK